MTINSKAWLWVLLATTTASSSVSGQQSTHATATASVVSDSNVAEEPNTSEYRHAANANADVDADVEDGLSKEEDKLKITTVHNNNSSMADNASSVHTGAQGGDSKHPVDHYATATTDTDDTDTDTTTAEEKRSVPDSHSSQVDSVGEPTHLGADASFDDSQPKDEGGSESAGEEEEELTVSEQRMVEEQSSLPPQENQRVDEAKTADMVPHGENLSAESVIVDTDASASTHVTTDNTSTDVDTETTETIATTQTAMDTTAGDVDTATTETIATTQTATDTTTGDVDTETTETTATTQTATDINSSAEHPSDNKTDDDVGTTTDDDTSPHEEDDTHQLEDSTATAHSETVSVPTSPDDDDDDAIIDLDDRNNGKRTTSIIPNASEQLKEEKEEEATTTNTIADSSNESITRVVEVGTDVPESTLDSASDGSFADDSDSDLPDSASAAVVAAAAINKSVDDILETMSEDEDIDERTVSDSINNKTTDTIPTTTTTTTATPTTGKHIEDGAETNGETAPEGSLASFFEKLNAKQKPTTDEIASDSPLSRKGAATKTSFEALASQQQELNTMHARFNNNNNNNNPHHPPGKEEEANIIIEYVGAPWGSGSSSKYNSRRHAPDMELLYQVFQHQLRLDLGLSPDASLQEARFPLSMGQELHYDAISDEDLEVDRMWKDDLDAALAAADQAANNIRLLDQMDSMEGDEDLSAAEVLTASTENKDDLVQGLDDIDKFFQGVSPPDELDVGAASGSSMQEVLMGKGREILVKRVVLGYRLVRRIVVSTKDKITGHLGKRRKEGSLRDKAAEVRTLDDESDDEGTGFDWKAAVISVWNTGGRVFQSVFDLVDELLDGGSGDDADVLADEEFDFDAIRRMSSGANFGGASGTGYQAEA